MRNLDTRVAIEYHEATKHSQLSVRLSRHYLDWDNKPHPFKRYRDAPQKPLPTDFPQPTMDALQALGTVAVDAAGQKPPDARRLAELLFFTAGITRVAKYPIGYHYFRAAPATGALYPIEVYVVCGGLEGLEAGVYHFAPLEFALHQLRPGDWRPHLGAAAASPAVASAPASLVLSSLAWRNAWKYQARSYRHWFWDSGVMAANLLATAASEGIGARVVLGFRDGQVNRLLGLDGRREAAVAILPLGEGRAPPEAAHETIPPLSLDTAPLSRSEVEYAEIYEIHAASALATDEEVKAWAGVPGGVAPGPPEEGSPAGKAYPLQPQPEAPSPPLGEVILRRGSTRRFAQRPIAFSSLSRILAASTRGLPADFLGGNVPTLVDLYLIVNAVDGLPSGAYYYNRAGQGLVQLKDGEFRSVAGYLCLEQALGADASAVIFLMSRLDWVLRRYGNRGYRACQFEAGVVAGKLYLAAYAVGIGATGLTFYDDDVTAFFSPHAREKSNMLVVALGVPAYRAKPGQVLAGKLPKDARAL